MKSKRNEHKAFNAATDTILKADPIKVKTEMEETKRQRDEQLKAKKQPSASGRVSGGRN